MVAVAQKQGMTETKKLKIAYINTEQQEQESVALKEEGTTAA